MSKYGLKDFHGALSDFEQCLILDPQNIKSSHHCGCLNAEIGRYEESVKYFDQCLQMDP